MRLKHLIGASIMVLSASLATGTLSTPAAADYYAGLRAFDSKNYGAALQEWTRSAQAGDARSQFRLGILYAKGLGVAQNKETAYYWYKKAEKSGNADAGIAAVFLKKELPAARARAVEARIAAESGGGTSVATRQGGNGAGNGASGGGSGGGAGGDDTGGGGGDGTTGNPALRSLIANGELRRVAPGTQGRERYEIWKFNSDGTVSGSYSQTDAGSLAYTHEGSDRGTWVIEGSALCVTWRKWDQGRKRCYELTPMGRNKYRAQTVGANETWIATISAR